MCFIMCFPLYISTVPKDCCIINVIVQQIGINKRKGAGASFAGIILRKREKIVRKYLRMCVVSVDKTVVKM